MTNNRTLWIASIAGTVLTGLLMFILYSQVKPMEQQPATHTGQGQLKSGQQREAETKPVPETRPEQPATRQQAPVTPVTADKPAIVTPAPPQQTNLPELPADPTLPPEEIAKLSAEEKKKYQNLVTTYQEVRTQILNLHREREQLRQQMERVIEENRSIDQQLDGIRAEQNKQ
ncbi:MAG: hypothetical protein R3F02_15100 [Thiolinea sp.]